MLIGLTGGFGCGKSTALAFFQTYKFNTIDSDKIVENLLQNDISLIETIKKNFGNACVQKGKVNKPQLAKRVFSSKKALEKLESFIHPKVTTEWETLTKNDPQANFIVEVPLLFEKKLDKNFDSTICLTAALDTQLKRLSKKGYTLSQIKARLAYQMPLAEKEILSNFVICNNGTLIALNEQIQLLIKKIFPNKK